MSNNFENTKLPNLIGLSGCSNGSKTTLTNHLLSEFKNSVSIAQDNYYYLENSGFLEYIEDINYYNYDVLSAINMNKFYNDLIKLINYSPKYDYIFVDGFLLYEDDRLSNMLHKKYIISVDETTCRYRRKGRVYDGQIDPETYFERYVWPNFIQYKNFCKTRFSDIVYLDGTDSINNLVKTVKNDIRLL